MHGTSDPESAKHGSCLLRVFLLGAGVLTLNGELRPAAWPCGFKKGLQVHHIHTQSIYSRSPFFQQDVVIIGKKNSDGLSIPFSFHNSYWFTINISPNMIVVIMVLSLDRE